MNFGLEANIGTSWRVAGGGGGGLTHGRQLADSWLKASGVAYDELEGGRLQLFIPVACVEIKSASGC